MRGGFTVRVTYVRENRAYINERIVDVPWTNKQLTITWEHFRSLLEPGQKETWTAVIQGTDAAKAVAEMAAALYDASLDQYLEHDWLHSFTGFYQESSRLTSRFENVPISFVSLYSYGMRTSRYVLSLTGISPTISCMCTLPIGGAPSRSSRGGDSGVTPAPSDSNKGIPEELPAASRA